MTKIIETQAATFRGDTVALDETGILSWLHFGDLFRQLLVIEILLRLRLH